jgi:cobalt-zinc-cadmium efflux system outer membrane protein
MIGTLMVLAARGACADTLRMSIDEFVARVVAMNLELGASRKDISVAEADLERSRPLLPSNPAFTAGAQHATGFAPNYSFTLSQEFEIAGQRRARINAAQKEIEKTTWDVKNAEQTLAATAKTAFIHALISIDRVTVTQKGIDAIADLVQPDGMGRAPSATQRIELNQARIQAARSQRALAWAEHLREGAFSALRGLLGLPAEQELVLTGTPQTEARQLPSEQELIAAALAHRSDLIALRRSVEHADLHLALTRREGIPNVTLSGTLGRFEADTFAGGDVTVPLPVFQRKAPEVHEALAEYERARLQVQGLERDIAKEVLDARRLCTLTAADLQMQQRQIVPLSEENLAIERRLYDRGEVSAADVVGLQADAQTARIEYLDAVEAYNNALIELERVAGGKLSGE